MKKVTYLTVYAALFLLLSNAVIAGSGLFPFPNAWVPLGIAFALLTASTVLSIVFREKVREILYGISALNGIALGFSIRAWYIYRNIRNSFWSLLLVSLACLAVLFLFYAISFVPFVDRHYGVFFLILSAAGLVLYVLALFLLRGSCISTFGFEMIFAWALAICMCSDSYGDSFYRKVLLASFSIWLVAILILMLMTNGDGLDLDMGDFTPDSPRKSRTDRYV